MIMRKILHALLPVLLILVSANINAQSVQFDGVNDHIDFGNDTTLKIGGNAITLEAWIFCEVFPDAEWKGSVIVKDQTVTDPTGEVEGMLDDGYLLRVGGNGRVNFNIGSPGDNTLPDGWSWNEITTPENTIQPNTWHHIAGVYDSSDMMRIYVDGAEVTWSEQPVHKGFAVSYSPIHPLMMGKSPTFSDRVYTGVIDEARIWNVARTPAQLFEAKDKELCVEDEEGLVAYYKFNEGEGTIAADETGTNDGTFGGSADSTDYHPTWVQLNAPINQNVECSGTNISTTFFNGGKLGQNYPNPSSVETIIPFTLEHNGDVAIWVYNLIGKEVANVEQGFLYAGTYLPTLDVSELTEGMYVYQLHVNGKVTASRKMIVH